VSLDTVVDEDGACAVRNTGERAGKLFTKAEETVKDSVYQRRRRNGKAVPAHVEVKIQVWYEP